MDLCDAYQIFGEIRIRKHLTEKNHKKKHAVKLACCRHCTGVLDIFSGDHVQKNEFGLGKCIT